MSADAIDYIADLLEDKVEGRVKLYGDKEIRCPCPFHNGRNDSSFRVNFTKVEAFYNCWSCKENGDLIDLVSFLTNKSRKASLKLLNTRTNIGSFKLGDLGKKLAKIKSDLSSGGVKAMPLASLPPKAENQEPMLSYLTARSKRSHNLLRPQYICAKYGLYYCAEGRMAGRIIMPLYVDGKLVSYNDRTIIKDAKQKSKHPYNSDFNVLVYGLQQAIGKKIGVIVEGAFDLFQIVSFFSRNKGYEDWGVVALMNTLVNHDKAALIADVFDEVLLMLDHDKAGLADMDKTVSIFEEYLPVKNITREMPYGKDPGKCSEYELKKYFNAKVRTSTFLGKISNRISGLKYE